MELHQVEVSTMRSHVLPWMQEAQIVPVGDIQYGAVGCDLDRLRAHVEWTMLEPNRYLIGMGDYVDFGSPSNRGALKSLIEKGTLYDTSADLLDDAAQGHLEELLEVLAPTKGRWLGMLEGHHYWEFNDGTTSDTRLCQALDAPFLGTCALVNVQFHTRGKNHQRIPSLTIWCHHGRGSGALQSAPLNKLERLMNAWEGVDVFLLGHHHKKTSAKVPRLRPFWMGRRGARHELRHRNIIIAGTGGFLRGYVEYSERKGRAKGNYIEDGMLTPVALGGVVISARPRIGHASTTIDLDISL